MSLGHLKLVVLPWLVYTSTNTANFAITESNHVGGHCISIYCLCTGESYLLFLQMGF